MKSKHMVMIAIAVFILVIAVAVVVEHSRDKSTEVHIDESQSFEMDSVDYSKCTFLQEIMDNLSKHGGRISIGYSSATISPIEIEKKSAIIIYGDMILIKQPSYDNYRLIDVHDITRIVIYEE